MWYIFIVECTDSIGEMNQVIFTCSIDRKNYKQAN